MVKRYVPKNQVQVWSLRIADLFFPTFGELRYITLVAAYITLVVVHTGAREGFGLFAGGLGGLIGIIFFAGVTAYVFKKQRLTDEQKLWVCMIYYGFFMFLAGHALGHHPRPEYFRSALDAFNYWIVYALLVLAFVRGFLAVMIVRISTTDFENALLGQNFRDTQYRPLGFIITSALAAISVVILNHHYNDASLVLLLGFTYASATMTLIKPLLGKLIRY